MKQVCATCRWLEYIPFGEGVCANEDSEYADCPCDNPENDTCDYWEEKE